jgi:hypothetical protein
MTVRTAPGEVEVKVTRTHIESKTPQQEDKEKLPPLWEYVEALTDADWASGGYRFIIERGRPEWKGDDRTYIGDFFEKLMPADIAQRWGGGDYTIWFKIPPKGQQLKFKNLLRIDGAPKISTGGASSSSNGNNPSSDPLMRFVDMMDRRMQQMEAKLDAATGSGASSRAVEQAVGLTGQVFSAATAAATSTLQSIAGGSTRGNPLLEGLELLKAAKEILGPPPGGPVSNSVKDFLEMLTAIKGAGLLGAPAAGNTVAQLAIEGIRVLPAAISEGVKGLEHWHLAEEARARQVALMRGQNPNPIDVTPHAPAAPPPVSANAPPPPPPVNPNPTVQGAPAVEVNIETIELGLARILLNQSFTIEEAAHRAAALMEDLVPGMPDKVASAGEAQILMLFQTRPLLMQVPQNPRLTEFIKKFIEVVKAAPVMTSPQPPNVPPA